MSFKPTGEQGAILGHDPDRHARILAGPGTGKSATVIEWLARQSDVRAKLLTFTRAATAELIAKLEGRDDLSVERPSTIHSFCISVLLRNGNVGDFPRPFRMADDWEFDKIVLESLGRRLKIDKPKVKLLFTELAANWESLSPDQDIRVAAEDRARFMGGWQEHRQQLGYTLPSELPWALRAALNDHPDLEGLTSDVLVVDEYQDLNACDLDVLRLIAERGCKIIAAGDDDQSIYSFRKAHPVGIQRFLSDYADAKDYPLTVTRRCPKKIIEWANYVITGDPDRPRERETLRCSDGAADGEVALLSFDDNEMEARGVGGLVKLLAERKGVPHEEILILLRSDHKKQFSRPIHERLTKLGIPFSDANAAKDMLAEATNRRVLGVLRLAVNPEDSLAWATILELTPGVGPSLIDYVYKRAKESRVPFGTALLEGYEAAFPGLSKAVARRAAACVADTRTLIERIKVPESKPQTGWGSWIVEGVAGVSGSSVTEELAALLRQIDGRTDDDASLDRYLGQITPVAKDIALEKRGAVRIMTLAGSKGLTVRAAIVVGLENGIIPLAGRDLAEERRLLYVGMTRAEEFLYGTWARRRRGPTARTGRAQVNDRRRVSPFVEAGPVKSQEGIAFIKRGLAVPASSKP